MTDLTRRDVLRVGMAGAAALALPQRLLAQSATLPEPPLLALDRSEPGLAVGNLVAEWTRTAVGDTTAWLRTYNGSFPGPTIRVREGERVRLSLTNRTGDATNLHTHGLHVDPAIDDPFLSIAPGDTWVYEFDVPSGAAGTHWYHPHVHGSVARQLFEGLAGALIVEGPLDSTTRLRRIEEHVLVFKDLSLHNGTASPHTMFDWMNGKEGDLLLVNGVPDGQLVPRRGTLRLRLLNASNARYYHLALEGHPLHLIATDGHFLGQPVELDALLLAPGERADVLVQLAGRGSFRLLDLGYDRGSGHMMGGGHMMGNGPGSAADAPHPLLTIVAPARRRTVTLPSRLTTVDAVDTTRVAQRRRFVLGEAMMGRAFSINGRTFDHERVDVRTRLDDVEIWEIVNGTGMDHPMHLHTYPFQVLSRNGTRESRTAWKDVVNVETQGRVELAVPLSDFGGKTVYHCHIVEHEDLGMMGVLEVA